MLRASSLFSLCQLALLFNVATPMRASAETPIVFDDLVGTYLGAVEGEDVLLGDNAHLLRVQSRERNVVTRLLPYIEQENLYATLKSNRARFASDGIGLCFLFEDEGGGAATMTGMAEGPLAPHHPALAFVRPFAMPGCELPPDLYPGMMNLDGAGLEDVTFEVIDSLPGLFTACLTDETGTRIKLVGTTSADGRFLATGVGKGETVRISGELTTDPSGQPTAIEASLAIEDRFGKPVANGIIAILIGLWDSGSKPSLN